MDMPQFTNAPMYKMESEEELATVINAVAEAAEGMSVIYNPADKVRPMTPQRKARIDEIVTELKEMASGLVNDTNLERAMFADIYRCAQANAQSDPPADEMYSSSKYEQAKRLGYSDEEANRLARFQLTDTEQCIALWWIMKSERIPGRETTPPFQTITEKPTRLEVPKKEEKIRPLSEEKIEFLKRLDTVRLLDVLIAKNYSEAQQSILGEVFSFIMYDVEVHTIDVAQQMAMIGWNDPDDMIRISTHELTDEEAAVGRYYLQKNDRLPKAWVLPK